MICHCRLVDYNKYISGLDVDCMSVKVENMRKLIFAVNLKLLLKNKPTF